ncbi:uncharacterized protein LOC116262428 isoform X2 [Nymphaea colorata]|uniref:uncharacterized protein LOC116262428 isoform X2 n=1 Tax=Nymphaea colorata TaxID=210225 RepID=UPI00214E27E6|nr:uncharacterized protein LOC116262428 isoform X2 [Nymphaea colorata]
MEFESDLPQKIVDLLASAGYSRACDSSLSVLDKVTGGLAWCISRCNTNSDLCVASDGAACLQDQLKVGEIIGVALRSVGCPHPLETHQIQGLDYDHVYPVLEWIVNRITSMRENMRDEKNADPHAQSNEAGEKLHTDEHSSDFEGLERLFGAATEKRDRAQQLLTSRLRKILHLKHQVDDMPTQMELIQYERRFAELYMQIQKMDELPHGGIPHFGNTPNGPEGDREKLQHTRRLYDTYNALLETKELASKEISLLNSINQQFQDAITSTSGRIKLINSLESISNGTQQKLDKLRLSLEEEQKICSGLKEKLAATTEEQHRFSSLLKSFQDEYAKNESLRTARAPT